MASDVAAPDSYESKAAIRRPNRRINFGKIAVYAILIFGAAVALVPFLYTISVSLMNLTEATGGAFLPGELRFDNYLEAWKQAKFATYIWNSVRITLITVAGQLTFCTLAAYAFARMEFPGKNLLFVLLLATLMLPEAVTWIPNFITISWLENFGYAWRDNWPALTVPFMAGAFGIFLLRQFFQQIPEELWDSAQIDGAGHIRYLLTVILPLSRAPLVTLALFTFIASWNGLAWPLLVTTDETWRPITVGFLAFLDEAGAQFHLQMAGSIISMLPVVIFYFFVQRQFTESIASTGLKG
jgi:ABC-type glycerol-3-phosphate transport system permease component